MKSSRPVFAATILGLLLVFSPGSPSFARGGGGYGGGFSGGGGHSGGFGSGGGYGGHEGGFGGGGGYGGHGDFYGGDFGHDHGYAPRVGLPFDRWDFDSDDDYSDYYCGRMHRSYNTDANTYIDSDGSLRHCP